MKLFFNSSMPRSGSELFQVLLHQNPTIYASPTSPLLEYQFAARNNFKLPEVQSQPQELMEKSFLSMCGSMAEGYYGPITKRPNIIDKNRGWLHYYEWVNSWRPDPKMVCLVRDPRSVIASMEKIYRKSRHLPIGPDNPANIQNMTVEARADYWLNTQPIGLALQRLMDIFQKNLQHKVLFLRYEDLVASPQETLNKWYEFVDLPSIPHNFDSIVKTVEEDSKVFGPYGDHEIRKELKSQDSWTEILPQHVGSQITKSCRWFFETFNYI